MSLAWETLSVRVSDDTVPYLTTMFCLTQLSLFTLIPEKANAHYVIYIVGARINS